MKNKSPTNAQMERSDEIEARRIAIKKIKEREIEGDTLRLPIAKPHRVVDPSKTGSKASGIRFEIPAARPYRPQTPAGGRSYHFRHEPVTRSERPSSLSDRRDRPGSPADHTKYIERESAVASLDPASACDQTSSLSEFTSDDVARSAADQAAGLPPNPQNDAGSTPEQRMNYYDCNNTPTTQTSAIGLEQLPIRQPDTETAGDDQPGERSRPHAALWPLPNGELVCDTWEAPCPLLGDGEIPLDEGLGADSLRCPPQSDRPDRGTEPEYLAGVGGSEAARTDQYIIRPSAVAFQPDGTRALITNIDDDPEERVKFWNSVERYERKSSGDKMKFCVSTDPAFWHQVAAQPDCPPELFIKITGDDADKTTPISIKNGKEVRRFLSKQPGWEQGKRDISRDGQFPLAKFSDGRGGRVQYRIIVELPAGLSMEARFRIMKAFAHEFEKRGLPFIAVIHAPDEHNHDDNWHIHFAYWDRPCRKIDQDDIDSLSAKGFDTRQLKPGMWDFTCAVHKFNRPNRKSFPLRQNKVLEISRDKGWPKYLRRQFAQCVNEELELIGSQMRFDPRKYEEMDIDAVPQDRLGPSDHAREVKGEITETGVRNEQKQWDAIKAKLTADHQRNISAIDGELADLMRGLAQHPKVDEIKQRFKAVLQEAADVRYQLNIQEQELERQASRARFIYTRNRQVLDAHEARESKLSRKKEREVRDLVEQARAYLDQLKLDQADQRKDIADTRLQLDEGVVALQRFAARYAAEVTQSQQQAEMPRQRSAPSTSVQPAQHGSAQQSSVKPAMPATPQTVGRPSAINQSRTASPPVERNPATTEPMGNTEPSGPRQERAGSNAEKVERQRQESRDQLARILADREEKRAQRAQDERDLPSPAERRAQERDAERQREAHNARIREIERQRQRDRDWGMWR
jgi:hypothetical protein